MGLSAWSQDVFSKGELSPLMYSRVTVSAYYNGLKTATNCITYPQGGIGKRFGTVYNATIPSLTDYRDAYFQTFQYLNECTYVLIFIPDSILIYLEGILVHTVASTGIAATVIRKIDTTTLDARFRVATGVLAPYDLTRSANTANVISSASSNLLTLTTPVSADTVYPVQFTTSNTLPTTVPQVRLNQTYFVYTTSTTTAQIFTSSGEAKSQTDAYTITDNGAGTNNLNVLNNWSFALVVFRNLPVYDFTPANTYDTKTFTPGATTGYGITLNASSAIFTTAYVGGAFIGNGGISRIKTYVSSTQVTIDILTPFDSTAAITGSETLLAEPAWSEARGWPSKCSSFQNRSVFANSTLLPNGVWLSVTNDYDDFNGLEKDDDDAISWYPSSDNVNFIRFIVPYRSLTIHTNTGIYSTPLSFEQAVTPSNFSMTLQDSTPATAIQPRGIDNQIIILSGNDVHSMLWDGYNNSYTSNIASIASEHLITGPHDETAYVDLNRAGSRYMFIINDDGSLVIYQTLISEDVSGFTPATLYQSYGKAYFRWSSSSADGQSWFLTERQLATEGDPFPINEFTQYTLISAILFELLSGVSLELLNGEDFALLQNAVIFVPGVPTPFQFQDTGTLPSSFPQVEAGVFYWAVSDSEGAFTVYLSSDDAADGLNPIEFFSAGTDAYVVPQNLETTFLLEELSFDVKTDCTYLYNGTAKSTFTDLPRFNAQEVKINGDEFGFDYTGDNDTIETISHGASVDVSDAEIGFAIRTVIEPLAVAPPGPLGYKGTAVAYPQHIRNATFMFNSTTGGFINDTPIQLNLLEQTYPGVPSGPQSGLFEMSFMQGWEPQYGTSGITITHDEPFDIQLIGIFYQIES